MSNNVINMADHKPHLSGEAKCIGCLYEWVAVSPVGATELECPECGTLKGVYLGMVTPNLVLECNCGNQHFFIDPDWPMCSLCGTRMIFDD